MQSPRQWGWGVGGGGGGSSGRRAGVTLVGRAGGGGGGSSGRHIRGYTGITVLLCAYQVLTHWGQVTHQYVGNLAIIGSDNGLSHGRHQAIIWTNTGILYLDHQEESSMKFQSKCKHFHSRKCIWKCRLRNGGNSSRPQWVKARLRKSLRGIHSHNYSYPNVTLTPHETGPYSMCSEEINGQFWSPIPFLTTLKLNQKEISVEIIHLTRDTYRLPRISFSER